MRVLVSLLAAFAVLCAPMAVRAEEANTFLIANVRVFDGERIREHQNVLVRDGRIETIGRRLRATDGVDVIDGAGKTLLPGLIDAHVHVFGPAQADALRFGVTTELDMFHMGQEYAAWRAQRASLARVTEADTWSAGVGASTPGGHPNKFVPENMPRLIGAENARAFVDARIAEGSDYIKIIMEDGSVLDPAHTYASLSTEEVCAAVEAAHAAQKKAIVHVTRVVDATAAVECGADMLAHVPSDAVNTVLARYARTRNVSVITTLAVVNGVFGVNAAQDIAARADVAPFLSQSQRGSLTRTPPGPQPDQITRTRDNVRLMHRAGVRLLAGSDSPGPGTAHGLSLHHELALLVEAGLTPIEALRAATSAPADAFGLDDRGRIRAGARADLLLVDGDPTAAIGRTLAIERIWKNGYPVDRAAPPPAD